MSRTLLPQARHEDLVVQAAADELLVFDRRTDKAYVLNPIAAAVWQLCDGHHAVADLSRALALDEQTISYALQQLEREHLLQNDAPLNLPPITRREFMKRMAIAAAAVPVVQTIRVPSPSNGVSCAANGACVSVCTDCCSTACFTSAQCSPQFICSDPLPP